MISKVGHRASSNAIAQHKLKMQLLAQQKLMLKKEASKEEKRNAKGACTCVTTATHSRGGAPEPEKLSTGTRNEYCRGGMLVIAVSYFNAFRATCLGPATCARSVGYTSGHELGSLA